MCAVGIHYLQACQIIHIDMNACMCRYEWLRWRHLEYHEVQSLCVLHCVCCDDVLLHSGVWFPQTGAAVVNAALYNAASLLGPYVHTAIVLSR